MADRLWTIRGTKPVAWQIPLWGIQKGDFVELVPALPLLNCQKVALHEKISEHGFCAQGIYKVKPYWIEKIARAHPPGTQPEEMLVWGPRRQPIGKHSQEKRDRGEFIDALSMTGAGTPAECEWWFKHICNLMLDWLINQDRTVDLYFARLHPTHMSLDWFRRMQKAGTNERDFLTDQFRNGCGLRIARPHRECERRVELELTRVWKSLAEKIEQKRFAVLKRRHYADTVQPLLHSQEAFWRRQFDVYRSAFLGLPARFVACEPAGCRVIVPSNKGWRAKQRKSERNLLAKQIQWIRDLIEERGRAVEQLREVIVLRKKLGAPHNLRRAHALLRDLRDLRSLIPELRDTRGIMDESVDPGTRTIWMLVRLSHRKLNAQKLLVKRLNSRLERMAEKLKQLSG